MRRAQWIFAALLIMVTSTSFASLRVLVVHSYESHLPWVSRFAEGLLTWQDGNIELYSEFLDAERLDSQSHDVFAEYLLNRYQSEDIDAILLDSSAASLMADRNRLVLDAISPVRVYYSVLPINLNETEVLITPDFADSAKRTMRLALQMNPNLQKVVVIEGPTFIDRNLAGSIADELRNDSVEVEWLRDFTMQTLREQVEALPLDSAIFMSLVFQDSEGGTYIPKEVAKEVIAYSKVPSFTLYSTFMGTGSIGGYMFDPALVAHEMLDAAADVVANGRITQEYQAERPVFDMTAMSRFQFDEDILPSDAVRVNPPLSMLQRYPRLFEMILLISIVLILAGAAWLGWQSWYNARLKSKNSLLSRLKSELTQANEKLHELAMYDSLTHLLNRQAAEPILAEAVSRQRRYHTPAVLLVIDIDDFKQVNDTYGHKVGDVVLKKVACIINNSVRESDLVARWGGEEFVVLLNNAEVEGASIVARSLCQNIESQTSQPQVTVSIGGAPLLIGDDWGVVFNRADKALYERKRQGKNGVRFKVEKSDLGVAEQVS